MSGKLQWAAALLIGVLPPDGLVGQELRWELDGAIAIVPGTNGTALRVRRGSATLRDVEMENGSVSFTLKATPARGFIGVNLRTDENGSRENFYLRPHKTNAPDALQYTPSFGGADTNWQLFHGPGGTAAAPTQDEVDGIAVEIVFSGRRAAMFIGDSDEPALDVPRLALEPRSGGIVLYGSVLQPTVDSLPVQFENIRISETSSRTLPDIEQSSAAEGTVTTWGVGRPFRVTEVPTEVPSDTRYTARSTEPNGTLMIDRHVARPEGTGALSIASGLVIHSEREQRVRMELGFSDLATVFLNGEPIFEGDLRYSYELPMRQGFFYPSQNVLHLPLRAGRNELVVMVSESFGGWALSARFPDGGVRTEPLR